MGLHPNSMFMCYSV